MYKVLAIAQRLLKVLVVVAVVKFEPKCLITELPRILVIDEAELEIAESHAIVVLLILNVLLVTYFVNFQ